MTFSEFVHKLHTVISAGSSTHAFTRTVFEEILTEEGQEILLGYSDSSFKGFYNGNTQINRIAQRVNAYVESMKFSAYIHQFSDQAVETLCNLFSDELPGIGLYNAGDMLADLFVKILNEAAGASKNVSVEKKKRNSKESTDETGQIELDFPALAPDLAEFEPGSVFIGGIAKSDSPSEDPFNGYLKRAIEYYSQKKTLLNPEEPRDFYDIYVCNDLKYHKVRMSDTKDTRPGITISDGTVPGLQIQSRYIIIEGTGGIGKSMYLTHLFLSSADEYDTTGQLPILLLLKDYKEDTSNLVEFIWKAVKEYDPGIRQRQIIEALENQELILLMDGLDEIQSSLRESFNADLEALVKSYPGNTIIATSRPVHEFISYTRFSLFDIQPLTKEQALALIEKIEFWDDIAKQDFIKALDKELFWSHYEFASNPLLLTIMLMTYSSFGEVPAKMHVFYSKAYETMARLHDATKGSFKRPLYTKLTPEDFAKYFAEFCARTYAEEMLEFTERTFSIHMERVIKDTPAKEKGVTPKQFLDDLTDNLCIMYKEGGKYYFIHRSFQEYFAAVYFAYDFDSNLIKVGNFFEKMRNRVYSDRTFDMLYDMRSEKVERFIFLPFLEALLERCEESEEDPYWEFLSEQYPILYYEEGDTGESYLNSPSSFIFQTLIRYKRLGSEVDISELTWPDEIHELNTRDWVCVYKEFMDPEAFAKYPSPEFIPEEKLSDMDTVAEEDVPYQYYSFFGEPDIVGATIEIDIDELRKSPNSFIEMKKYMESDTFPLLEEYRNVKKYYKELLERTTRENESDRLFDD